MSTRFGFREKKKKQTNNGNRYSTRLIEKGKKKEKENKKEKGPEYTRAALANNNK